MVCFIVSTRIEASLVDQDRVSLTPGKREKEDEGWLID